jgi:hypothetical protein
MVRQLLHGRELARVEQSEKSGSGPASIRGPHDAGRLSI